MQLTINALALLAAASAALAGPNPTSVKATFDQTYDNPSYSLSNVACSNGDNGLLTLGYTTLDSLPGFPYVGGSMFVSGWNSPQCGSCWTLTGPTGETINLIAVDTSGVGFNVATHALQVLGGDAALAAGSAEVTVVAADPSACGF